MCIEVRSTFSNWYYARLLPTLLARHKLLDFKWNIVYLTDDWPLMMHQYLDVTCKSTERGVLVDHLIIAWPWLHAILIPCTHHKPSPLALCLKSGPFPPISLLKWRRSSNWVKSFDSRSHRARVAPRIAPACKECAKIQSMSAMKTACSASNWMKFDSMYHGKHALTH